MNKPLSIWLRPDTISKVIGQSHLINDRKGIITKMVERKFAVNLIFYGQPGIGKTSLAQSLANDLKMPFDFFNASKDKKEKLDKIIKTSDPEKPTILIVDEIHRMNRNIQDVMLELIENKQIILFCTTTENPYFVINPAIRSRCTILKLENIDSEEMYIGLKKIFAENDLNIDIDDDALKYLSQIVNGDLRVAINTIELLVNLYKDTYIDIDLISQLIDRAVVKGTGEGDEYHDLKSALQKSIRGSDVNASLHYWARLMAIGDFETLMRRMVIMSYEDIGLANPAIPMRVQMACDAFRKIGMPEGRIILGLAICEMALSEKSNSAYLATEAALTDVMSGNCPSIPPHLRDAHYKSASKLGHGIGYKYPHDYDNDFVKQQYLPSEIENTVYFNFKPHSSYEKRLMEIYKTFTKQNKIK